MEHLYRYFYADDPTNALQRIRQVVEDRKLWATSPLNFNDPFEFKFALSLEAQEQEIYAKFFKDNPSRSHADYKSWKQTISSPKQIFHLQATLREDYLNRHGVICFTNRADTQLMWSHYGPRHLSFCAMFDRNRLTNMKDLVMAGPVQYSETMGSFNYFKQNEEDLPQKIFFQKSSAWNYENEYRLICERPGALEYPPEALIGIVLGCRAHNVLRKYVRTLVGTTSLKFDQMVEAAADYKLSRIPIEKDRFVISSHY